MRDKASPMMPSRFIRSVTFVTIASAITGAGMWMYAGATSAQDASSPKTAWNFRAVMVVGMGALDAVEDLATAGCPAERDLGAAGLLRIRTWALPEVSA